MKFWLRIVFFIPQWSIPSERKRNNQNVFDGRWWSFRREDSPKKILDEKSPSKFKYIKEIIGENSAVLEFETEIDGIYVNGIDLISGTKKTKSRNSRSLLDLFKQSISCISKCKICLKE